MSAFIVSQWGNTQEGVLRLQWLCLRKHGKEAIMWMGVMSWFFPVMSLACAFTVFKRFRHTTAGTLGGIAFCTLAATGFGYRIVPLVGGYDYWDYFSPVFFLFSLVGEAGILAMLLMMPLGAQTESAAGMRLGAQSSDEFAELKKQLKGAGIGSVIFGLVAVGLGAAFHQESAVNVVLAVIGVLLFAEGVWILVDPRPVGLVVDGIALWVIGIWNIVITIHNMSYGGHGTVFGVLGVFQIIWGVNSIRRYGKFARTLAQPGESPVE
jgi:hypothetical protein